MKHIFIHRYQTPYGLLVAGDYEGQLCLLDWQHRAQREQIDRRLTSFFNAVYETAFTPLHEQVTEQLASYFRKERTGFELPLLFAGTDFQQKVWRALLDIPYGKTVSYLELSRQLGDEKAIRAVAAANGANGISIIVPCHRVIGSSRSLTGYAGGLIAKQRLLELESNLQQAGLFDE